MNSKQNTDESKLLIGENPTLEEPRLVLVFLVDTSGSMNKNNAIDKFTNALNNFIKQATKDLIFARRVDVAVIEFNSTIRMLQEFTPLSKMQGIFLKADGLTNMGQGVNIAIDMVKERVRLYQEQKVKYYKPGIVMFTDGKPTDILNSAIERLRVEELNRQLIFLVIGTPGCDMQTLMQLTKICIELDFKEYDGIFSWIQEDIKRLSNSPGDRPVPVDEPPQDLRVINDWLDDWI